MFYLVKVSSSYSARNVHSEVYSALGIGDDRLARYPEPSKGEREAMAEASANAAGNVPFAVQMVWDFAEDVQKTCLSGDNLAQRLQRSSEQARGLGELRCPSDTVPLPPREGGRTELGCAKWHPTPLKYDEARAECRRGKGVLVSPVSKEVEDKLLVYLRRYTNRDRYWAGVYLVRADEGRPMISFDNAAADVKYWDLQWNARAGDITGLPCCHGIDTMVGDPRCLLYDAWRELQGVHPYPVGDCEEQHPFFCEYAAGTYDVTTQKPVVFSTKIPSVFYSALPPRTVKVFDRKRAQIVSYDCTEKDVLRPIAKRIIQEELALAVRHITQTLSPLYRSQSIAGHNVNRNLFNCANEYFSWDLANRMQRGADGVYSLPGVDLLVLLSFTPDVATVYSFVCGFARDGRPNVIVLNVAPSHLDVLPRIPIGRKKLRTRMIQSLLHSLGFNEHLFHMWKQPVVNKTVASDSCVTGLPSCRDLAVVVTPFVKDFIMTKHFKCKGHPQGGSGTLPGAELENSNLLLGPPYEVVGQWEKRIFRGEIMTSIPPITEDSATETEQITGLTLAAFKDMGWYRVNELMAGRLKWGWRQRCTFASDDCSAWPERYKCSGTALQRVQTCSPDFLSIGYCNVAEWPAGEIPAKFRWVSQSHPITGGQDLLMDWCLLKERSPGHRGSCLTEDTACDNGLCGEYHSKGANSRCFETTLRYKEYEQSAASGVLPPSRRGTCVAHKCVPSGGSWIVKIYVAGLVYDCQRKGATVGPSVSNPLGESTKNNHTLLGDIRCPDPREMCDEAGVEVLPTRCDPLEDCNSHGSCGADGRCQCFSPTTLPGPDATRPHIASFGFFQGPHCGECLEGYHPYPHCTQRSCPSDENNLLCSGHGDCDADGACICHSHNGHWSGPICGVCADTHYGAHCTEQKCVSDTTCGRGTCIAGRCACYFEPSQGYWAGARCNRCVDGYDQAQACRVRIKNYFACDAVYDLDALNYQPAEIDCEETTTAGQVCTTPRRVPHLDAYGCLLSPHIPQCRTQTANLTDPTQCACPPASPYLLDCKQFPLLFTSCTVPDECGCAPPSPILCRAGTVAAPPAGYNPQIIDSHGSPHFEEIQHAPVRQCECHTIDPKEFECGRMGSGTMVYFEPRNYQVFEEDFCHCTTPSVPVCSDVSKPYSFKIRAYSAQQDCAQMLRESGCPDWSRILNINQAYNSTSPDLSLMDCGGFPPPRYSSEADACGCPLPVFICIPGTIGVCDPSACPTWPDTIEIDCGGVQPPVSTLVGRHPCGCEPPPKPVCREGTQACCVCDYPVPETIWVECKGHELDPVEWDPEAAWPRGNPFIQPCDPCPECVPPPPVRKCTPGLAMRPAQRNPLSPCEMHPLDASSCIAYPPTCPIDCRGMPPPETQFVNECECPTPPVAACLPGTSGPDSLPLGDVNSIPCGADPTLCAGYACAPPQSLEHIAAKIGVVAFRGCAAREAVWGAVRAERTCTTACTTDLDCACGFKCGICGACRQLSAPDPPRKGNCLLDPSLCGVYSCTLTCENDADTIHARMILSARCNIRCMADRDCSRGTICSLPVYTPHPYRGAVQRGERHAMNNDASTPLDTTYNKAEGVPGLQQMQSEGDGVEEGRLPQVQYGECVVPPEGVPQEGSPAVYCYSHEECGAYACGKDNTQEFFSVSRCRSSCYVHGHCHPDYRCVRHTAVCVQAYSPLPSTRPRIACVDDPHNKLLQYGGCTTVLQDVDCSEDLARVFTFPPGSILEGVCPESCGLCVDGHYSVVERDAEVLQAESCVDDPDRALIAFGISDTQRCAQVIDALGCAGDVGSLVDGIAAGVLVQDICPRTCRKCTPVLTAPPYAGDNSSIPHPLHDPCAANHLTTPGSTLEEKCRNQEGCCFDAVDSSCFGCNRFAPNMHQNAVGYGQILPDRQTCDLLPFDHCAPYVCGGTRGLPPTPGSVCPTFCTSSLSCQPLYICEIADLTTLAGQFQRAGGTFFEETLRAEEQGTVGKGRCVVDPVVPPYGAGLLRVWVGALSGMERDPLLQVAGVAPFAAPPYEQYSVAVRRVVSGSAAECFPYVAVQPGITQGQVTEMQNAAASSASPPPSCKHYCIAQEDCVGRFFCTAAGKSGCTGPSCLGSQHQEEARVQPAKGKCQPRRDIASACERDIECATSHCVGGICCNSACKGECRTCDNLGICGWVVPETNPRGVDHCGRCRHCAYVPDVGEGAPLPSSPMRCVAVPYGTDPSNACPHHAVCNGEGGCVALSRRWDSSGLCAEGFEGADCAHSVVAYRGVTMGLEEDEARMCSAQEISHRSRAPFLGEHGRSGARVQKRSVDGFTSISAAPPKMRTALVNDLRPRQYAVRVLGTSQHSEFACSGVLGKPTPIAERLHTMKRAAYAPLQHYVEAGVEYNRRLKYSPYVNCPTSERLCRDTKGCVWSVLGDYCELDDTVTTRAEAEAVCMQQYDCYPNNITIDACTALWGRCALVVDGKLDMTRITGLREEWIELEYDEPVFIESVILHENYNPGSLVRIEIQQELANSASNAAAGGSVVETDIWGNYVAPRRKSPHAVKAVSISDICQRYTTQGVTFCNKQVGCLWDFSLFLCLQGSKCSVVKEKCDLLEMRGECYWDLNEKRCIDGSPCSGTANGAERARTLGDYCSNTLLNQSSCESTEHRQYCEWVPRLRKRCIPWSNHDECSRHLTASSCKDQRRGKNKGGLIAYCSWNHTTETCAETPAFHTCSHDVFGNKRTWVACNETTSCLWHNASLTCESVTKYGNATLAEECASQESSTCLSCAFSSNSIGCNVQCMWETVEVKRCEAHQVEQCSALSYARCNEVAVCTWRGRAPETEETGGRDATVLMQQTPQETSTADVALSFTTSCTFATKVVLSVRDKVNYRPYCATQTTKEACTTASSFVDSARICEWRDRLVPALATSIPNAPVSRYDLSFWEGVFAPAAFALTNAGTTYPAGPTPTKRETAAAPFTPRCEDVVDGTSMNVNDNPYTTVWTRDRPNFPTTRQQRETHLDVGYTGFRAKAVRLYFAPISSGLSQVEAVAIVGKATATNLCDGYVWASPLHTGTPSTAMRRVGSVWMVPCSGRGQCGVRGCVCQGNFAGKGCEMCKLGYTGVSCDRKIPLGCTVVSVEDTAQAPSTETRLRWAVDNARDLHSRVLTMNIFGTRVTSPPYHVSGQSHVRVVLGYLLIDVPLHGGACGMRVIMARTAAELKEFGQVVFTQRCPLYGNALLCFFLGVIFSCGGLRGVDLRRGYFCRQFFFFVATYTTQQHFPQLHWHEPRRARDERSR